eukprot:scaffold320864_cov13-Tisochrysis_lutea.AAC.1
MEVSEGSMDSSDIKMEKGMSRGQKPTPIVRKKMNEIVLHLATNQSRNILVLLRHSHSPLPPCAAPWPPPCSRALYNLK